MDAAMQIETEETMLKRIIALLLSLAGLADQASRRPYPLRCLVLWVMRPAEALAYEYIAGNLDDFALPDACGPADFLPHGSRARARRLARTFRRAARALQAQERHFARLKTGRIATDAFWLHDSDAARARRFCQDAHNLMSAPRLDLRVLLDLCAPSMLD